MPKILIVGGGYAGFYTALKLEKWLSRGEAEVTMVDPLPYMTYQPFLPEVAAGSIEPRHAVVSHRRHLKKTRVVTAKAWRVRGRSAAAGWAPSGGQARSLIGSSARRRSRSAERNQLNIISAQKKAGCEAGLEALGD